MINIIAKFLYNLTSGLKITTFYSRKQLNTFHKWSLMINGKPSLGEITRILGISICQPGTTNIINSLFKNFSMCEEQMYFSWKFNISIDKKWNDKILR